MSGAMATEAYANTNNTNAFPTKLTVPDQDRKGAGIGRRHNKNRTYEVVYLLLSAQCTPALEQEARC